MRNTLLLQLPGVRKICLYYIAAPVLLLCLFLGTACPAHAEEIADSSSSTSDSTDTDDDLTLGGDITDAYDKYAGGVDSGLDDVKDQYDGLVNDSTLGFVQAVTSWIPTEFWVIVGLSHWLAGRAGHRQLVKGVSVWNSLPLYVPLCWICSGTSSCCTALPSAIGMS